MLSPIITKAQQLPLTDIIRNTMARSAAMSGNIRLTDMAAVFAPNKQCNMAVFPMIWGFTVERSSKPLINCRIETADQKPLWKDSIHDRMPLILGKDSLREWVHPDSDPGRIAKKALTNMVMEKAVDYSEPKPEFMQI